MMPLEQIPAAIPANVAHGHHPVVVVDADPHARAELARNLRAAGHAVIAVASANEALDLAVHATPRALIVDVTSRSDDGRSVVDAVRALPSGHDIPVLVRGDSHHIEEFQRMLRAGKVWYIGRGAAWPQLQRTLSTMLARTGMEHLGIS